MKIIKRDGRLEEFNLLKVRVSLQNAANDINFTLNESDLKILVKDIETFLKKIRKDSYITSSYEVIGVIFEVLKRDGFNNILTSYLKFDK